MTARRARAVAAALAAAVALPAVGESRRGRPWYEPDHAEVQLAGNIGFVSPGAGWTLARRVDGDLFLGWVPAALGGADIFSLTGKLSFAPWSLGLGRWWRLRPLTAAVQLTYTFGGQYTLVPDELFPPTALRSGVALGGELSRRLGKRAVGLYAEVVMLDVGLVYWLSDASAVRPEHVASLALGARLDF